EYAPVVDPAGGTCIRFSPDTDTFMNPFDLTDVADKANQAQLAFKIDAILALSSATMAEGREGLPEADKSILSRCVELAYMRCEDKGRLPVLGDFYELLLDQEEPEARDIALR
ncbi:conjugal transfer protein TraC, partial [Adlercreutzia rubneri]|nr:conjugal transfer protein TraC [Adlercreutzia rubneri]